MRDYFENTKGVGVLATADADGKVNVAIYARPHFLDDKDNHTASFIMNERLSYANILANPHAAYLFIEEGDEYVGKRLSLTKLEEPRSPGEQISAAYDQGGGATSLMIRPVGFHCTMTHAVAYDTDLAFVHDVGFGAFARDSAPGILNLLDKLKSLRVLSREQWRKKVEQE